MVELSEAELQSDHAHWLNDFAAWSRDIDHWQARHNAVLVELRRIYASVVALKS